MKLILFVLLTGLLLASCSKEQAPTSAKTPAASPVEAIASTPVDMSAPASQAEFDLATIALGGKLYKQNCAVCHGTKAEGTPDWRVRNPDGKLKPPPLNGTAHTWHHSKALLLSIITEGTASQGGDMPAWGDKLSQQEMAAILTWLQSKWPKDIYESWLEINSR